ncbi:MAG: hypothetical protein KAH57_06280 [Thermoplasmata archaeon]|nr:hypothetical protein [Thermoplasmata archaeon]
MAGSTRNVVLIVLLILLGSILISGPSEGEEGVHKVSPVVSSISFAGGNGAAGNPYQVSNVTQLQNISANLTAHYILISDINASETESWNNGSGFRPIGNLSNKFSGSLEGQNNNITGLFINYSFEDNVGLFGYLNIEAVLSNVTLIRNNISGVDNIGGLVGYNDGMVSNSSVTGNVSGHWCVGGLVGRNYRGTVDNCSAAGNVSGDWYVGGFVGLNFYGTVSNSYGTGIANGEHSVGGLAGLNLFGAVSNSYAIGTVNGENGVGGLMGTNSQGTVSNSCYCINNTMVNDNDYVTPYGIYKNQFKDWMDNGRSLEIKDYLPYDPVMDCYNISNILDIKNMLPFAANNNYNYLQTADIDMSSESGLYIPVLIAGEFDGNGYNISNLNVTFYINLNIGMFGHIGSEVILKNISLIENDVSGNYNVGGLIGHNYGTVLNCFATGDISGNSGYIGGLVGWNGGTLSYCNSVGNICGKFQVGGLVGVNYGAVSNCSAAGNVSGDSTVGGLVGYNYRYCKVFNSYAIGDVSGNYRIGGLIGDNDGTVSNCYATGNVSGVNIYVGGLVGVNRHGTVSNCYAAGAVNGNHSVGGLVGTNERYGTVSNCYSKGMVNGNNSVGGLVGVNFQGMVYSCYSIGRVVGTGANIGGLVGDNDNGAVLYSFWDNFTSRQNTSEGGNGKNTLDMKKINTFPSVGWNFSSIWGVFENRSYPYLRCMDYGMPEILNQQYGPAFEDQEYFNMLTSWSVLPGGYGAYWNFTTNAGDWLYLTEDGILKGTPTNDDVRFHWVNITATLNGIDFDFLNSSLYVVNRNDDPVITTLALPKATEDELYSFTLEAIDIDPTEDSLKWSLETNAIFLDLDEDEGILSCIPTNSDVGEWWIRISVSDQNGGYDERNYTIDVVNVNDDPEILPISLQYLTEDQLFFIDLDAIDVDPTDDQLHWSILTKEIIMNLNYTDFEVPQRIKIDPNTGMLSGFANNYEVGSLWVQVTVTDEHGGSDQMDLYFDVINVNDDPIIASFDAPLAHRDVPYNLELLADDIDLTNDTLTWDLTTDAAFLHIDSSTGKIWGLPKIDDVGIWWVNVTITDWNGGFDWENFTITVVNDNHPPILIVTDLTLTMEEDSEGETLNLYDVFQDVDGDILSFEIEGYGPLTILMDGGIVTFIPYPNWFGTEVFHLTASDGEYSVDIDLIVIVTSVNDAPMGASIIAESSYYKNEAQILSATASDVDIPYGDTLTYRWRSDLVGGIGYSQTINVFLLEGLHRITITVTDSDGLSTNTTIEIEILPLEIEEKPDEKENDEPIPLLLLLLLILASIAIVATFYMAMRWKRIGRLPEE